MRIIVVGAAGGTGRRVVERALEDGHEVTAVARRPEAITVTHDRLRVVKGDVLDRASIEAAVAGADALVSTIGPANNKEPGTLMSDGTKNMIAACEAAGVKRFVFESGIMVGDGTGLGPLSKLGVAIFRRINHKLVAEKRIAEALLIASSLDYVIVRPPNLDDAPGTGTYVSGVDARVNLAKKLSHADVAHFLVRAASDPALVRTIQTIGH